MILIATTTTTIISKPRAMHTANPMAMISAMDMMYPFSCDQQPI
jgi:hypothetical protein